VTAAVVFADLVALDAAISSHEPACPRCAERPSGLCEREECRRAVLPQLAKNIGWLKLMGEVRTEQTKRQKQKNALTPTEKAKVAAIGRRNARKQARSKRGPYALLRAIANAR
jgi:hypothetical protein